MQFPFKHPLATHHSMEVLGFRRNGSPIYAIAGGNGEGEGGSGSGANSGGNGGAGAEGQGGTGDGGAAGGGQGSGSGSGQSGAGSGDGDGTGWKAESRKWEKRAKDNHTELETLRQQNMSEQEKAVSEAEKKGRTAAASEYGLKLANAEFRAAVAAAGIDLGEAAELIDVGRFVGDDGEVNVAAIKSAVTKLSKLAPKGAGRSGGDMSGGSGDQAPTLDAQIAQAKADGNWRLAMSLENSKLGAAEAAQQ